MLSITTSTVSIIALLALLLIVPINGSCILPGPEPLCGAGSLPTWVLAIPATVIAAKLAAWVIGKILLPLALSAAAIMFVYYLWQRI